MAIEIKFPGGMKVDAILGGRTIRTDQPASNGGDDSAPSPFDHFLASLATCAGIFVLFFCRQRNISTEGIRMLQHMEKDPATGRISLIEMDIHLPRDFPEKYRSAVVRAAEQCSVKKYLENPPALRVVTSAARIDA